MLIGMKKRIVIAGAAAVAVVGAAGGVAVATGAVGGDGGVAGPQADRAVEAALAATGGGTANAVERDGEDGASWEVEVAKPDGTTVDVRLDESLNVVVIEGDEDGDDGDGDERDARDDDGDEGGGRDDADDIVAGPLADRIADAALAANRGGTVVSVERDDDGGAMSEVEIAMPDGSRVEVHVDDNLEVVSSELEEADDD